MTGLPLVRIQRAEVPACHDEVCVTCSDQAVPVRVVALHGTGLATVDTGRGWEEVSVALVDASVGDVVLVHAKEAIAVLDPQTAPDPAAVPGPGAAPGLGGGNG